MSANLGRRAMLAAGLAAGSLPLVLGGTTTAHAASRRALIGPARDADLHVMSFNVRLPVDDPPHSWEERRLLIASLLRTERPTILGTQEGFFFQLQEILQDLGPSYDWIHLFRRGGSKDEATAILYDRERLKPVAYDHLWLSDTPLLIGSATWGNSIPRMLTWVRFLDRRTNKEFVHLNTHFDHQSEPARVNSARMLLDVAADFDVPTVYTGDFNVPHETSEPYKILVGEGGLGDTWVDADQQVTKAYGTFNGWNPPVVDGDRIDWILTTDGIATKKAAVNTWSKDGNNPSDHWPVQALIRLT